MTTEILFILAILTFILGFAGLVLPAVPALPVIFAGLVLAAWAEDFQYLGARSILFLALITLVGMAIDYLAGALGAKRVGASKRAVIGAMIGALIGLFFGIAGIILGPFIGAAIGQLTVQKDLITAGRIGLATWLGMVFGFAFKSALAFFMIGYYLFIRFL